MTTLPIPDNLVDLLNDLTLISLIDKEQKLNINTRSVSPSNTWGGAFFRSYYRESRDGLIDYLNKIIARTLYEITCYRDTEFCKIIVNHLNYAKRGLDNLCVTYACDPNILSQLNLIKENVDFQLSKNKKFLVHDIKIHNIPLDQAVILTRSE